MTPTGHLVALVLALAALSASETTYAQGRNGSQQTPRPSSSLSCEYQCQLDNGPCDSAAQTPEEHKACANAYRRCLSNCGK